MEPPESHLDVGGRLMYDLAAIAVAAVCFCFALALLYVLERV
jgi:hypothetical protein